MNYTKRLRLKANLSAKGIEQLFEVILTPPHSTYLAAIYTHLAFMNLFLDWIVGPEEKYNC